MVAVEGLKIKAKRIPKKQLAIIWKKLTDKPFPKITALILNDEDFNKNIERHKCQEDAKREIKEWGRLLSTQGTDACVFNNDPTSETRYVILIRKKHYHSLEEIIQHELSHIIRGDL